MTFWIVIFGYITILLKLYEFITFFIIIAIFISYKYYKNHISSGNIETDIKDDIQILVINHVDNIERIENKFFKYIKNRVSIITSNLSMYFGDIGDVLIFIILCIVFLYCGYLYFYDSLTSVAPAANESYLSLVWMKHLGNRTLFFDNIYPQGFYIAIETLQKIFQIDHIYIINFTGALNSLLTLFGIYYFVSRLSKNKFSGITAVIIYGILGNQFIGLSALQNVASPNQFAFMFLYPILYFFYEYTHKSRQDEFFVALLGSALIGLVHPLAFVCLATGLLTLCLANFLRDIKNSFSITLNAFIIMLISAVIAAIPIGIGLLFGKTFSSFALNLIFETDYYIKMPDIRQIDYLGLASLFIIFISAIFSIKNKSIFIKKIWIFLFGTLSFLFYFYAGSLTYSKYIDQGANTLWGLIIPIIISFAILALFNILKLVFRFKYFEHFIYIIIIGTMLYYLQQSPIISEKLDYNNSVKQYLKITKAFRPTQWMMVSYQEGYSLALGNGFHMSISEFIDRYDPNSEKLYDVNDDFKELETEDIFIFYQKNVFYNKLISQDEYMLRSNTNPRILEWLNKYKESHNNISLFYSDENIEIWQIHQQPDKEKIRTRIWQN
jgi:hypothetical protein